MSEYKLKKLKSYRLSDSSLSVIYAVAKEKNLTESEVARMFFDKGVYEYKLDNAIKAYYDNNLDLTGGARLVGISKREFMNELERKGIGINLDKETFDYGMKCVNDVFPLEKKKIEKKSKKKK